MISILVTAWKEEKTIGKALDCIFDESYSGIDFDYEVLLAAPDDATIDKAIETSAKHGRKEKLTIVRDDQKGKPAALNKLLKEARGEFLVFTDGDVFFDKNAVVEVLKLFENEKVGIVSGRPISEDLKNNMMGYLGHLLADAAHHKRTIDLTENPHGKSLKFVPKRKFFPVSGYLYAMRKVDIEFPSDCLVDDAYISYCLFNEGWQVAYAPEARVFVKYPTNLKDYFKQKKRSTGGYIQLWSYGVVSKETKSRTFFRELEYFWFPIKYAKSPKELFWSLCLYPIRLWLWLRIFWERKVIKKDFYKTWTRVESTK